MECSLKDFLNMRQQHVRSSGFSGISTQDSLYYVLLMEDIGEQIRMLHELQCMHRDIKPSNFLGNTEIVPINKLFYEHGKSLIRQQNVKYITPRLADYSIARTLLPQEGKFSRKLPLQYHYGFKIKR